MATGGIDELDWKTFNESRTGKLAMIVLVAVLTLIGGNLYNHHRAETQARSPLPGAGPGSRCDIWFIGSSTMQRWEELPTDMAPWRTVNRGIDGATFAQITERLGHEPAERPPRAIVLYAGENDLAGGTDVDRLLDELQRFLAVKTRMFGHLPVILLSLKPSPARWADHPRQLRYNAKAQQLAKARPDATYLEIGDFLMDGDKPGDHYVRDGIHLKPEAYRLWSPALKAVLGHRLGQAECTG